jgi:WD40 repeat protein
MTPELPEQRGEATQKGSPVAAGVAMRVALEKALQEPDPQRPDCPSIPDHALLHRIGTGAYGDVWLARSALGFLRAVKIVYRDRFDEERPYQREFHGILKYEPVSRTHEGLVAVLHVGLNEPFGYFYYVMELADPVATDGHLNGPSGTGANGYPHETPGVRDPARSGFTYAPRTLRSEVANRRSLSPPEAAKLALQLAEALDHLHAHGLVHRDVKPSNVIFVDRKPKLADIGLVTAAGDSRSFVGTEGFIPPEGPGSPGADLYGLGKLLYELATGRDRLDFPQLPPGLNQAPGGDALLELNEVITRACAPDPRQRYSAAAELIADLKLFLAGHSLRQARQRDRHLVFLRRFALSACLLVLLAGLAALYARQEAAKAKLREQESRQRADTELALRRRAEAAELEAQQQLYSALVEQARTAIRSGEMGHRTQALDALRRAAGISNNVVLRREALRALSLPDLRFEKKIAVQAKTSAAQLDPRFERLALCQGDSAVEIRSTSDNHLLNKLPASAALIAYFIKWSPDGRFLVVKRDRSNADYRADLEVWDVSGVHRLLLLTNTPQGAFCFEPQRPRFTAALEQGSIATWDLEKGTATARLKLGHDPTLLMIAPDGERFVQCFEQPTGWMVSVNLLTNGQTIASHLFSERLQWLEWHPSGAWIAAPDLGGSVHLMNSRTGETRTLGRHKVQAILTTFSPDGAYLISGGWERELLCWDMQTFDLAFTINLGSFLAQFRADGRECAIINDEGISLHAFEVPAYSRQFSEDLGGRIQRAVFSLDDRWLAAPGEERLGLWDLASKGPGAVTKEGADAAVFFSGDGHQLFASSRDRCYHWRIDPGTNSDSPPQLSQIPLDPPKGFTSLAVLSNLVAFTATRGSQVVNLEELPTADTGWAQTSDGINRFSPDDRWLAVFLPFDSVLHLYNLPQLTLAAALTNRHSINSFDFSPLGEEIAVSSTKRVEFWSTATWQRTREITNFMGAFFTQDGTALWLTKDYRTAGLYDSQDIKPLLPLPAGMLPLAISHDGKFIALSVDARRIQVWSMETIHKEFQNLGIDWIPARAASSASLGRPSSARPEPISSAKP